MDGKEMSKMIRKRKKDSLRPDMDSAGQEAQDPNVVLDEKHEAEVNDVLGTSPEGSASAAEMGENESSQSEMQLKKSMKRIGSYLDKLKI